MEHFRIVRKLRKALEEQFPGHDGLMLAEKLCNAGITELTNEIKDRIEYLISICKDFSFDGYWEMVLIATCSIDELCSRYERFQKYCQETLCSAGFLVLSTEEFDECCVYFKELGMSDEQQKKLLSWVIKHGTISKTVEEMKKVVRALERFPVYTEVRNEFIVENADFLFNDYVRDISENVEKVIDAYGERYGFVELREHPEILRFGLG